jgi:HSP20 family protein
MNRGYWPIERLMNDFLGSFYTPRQWYNRAGTKPLHVHWDEKDGNYIITAEVPGLEKDALSISYKDDYITLKATYGDDKEGVLRSGEYSFSGYFAGVDASKIDAQLKSGVLIVTLPKVPDVAATVVDIKSE